MQPDAWHFLDRATQDELLAYETLRQAEEAQSLGCPMFGSGA